jgi:hypothetical protein
MPTSRTGWSDPLNQMTTAWLRCLTKHVLPDGDSIATCEMDWIGTCCLGQSCNWPLLHNGALAGRDNTYVTSEHVYA